jgi:DNA-directed RNA polymerase subunit RPC12/RpoP
MSEPAEDAQLRYSCPRCQAELQAASRLAGTRQSCPSCEQSIRLPGIPTTHSPSEAATSAPTAGTPTNVPASARLALSCTQCGHRAVARGSQLGGTITCENCLEEILVVATTAGIGELAEEESLISVVEATPDTLETLDVAPPIKLTSDDLIPETPLPPPAPPAVPASLPAQPVDQTYNLDNLNLESPQAEDLLPTTPKPQQEISLDGLLADPVPARSAQDILDSLDPPSTASDPLNPQADSYHFTIDCLLCGKRLNVESSDIGNEVRCPECHSATRVREPASEDRQLTGAAMYPVESLDTMAQPKVPEPPTSDARSRHLHKSMDEARALVKAGKHEIMDQIESSWWKAIFLRLYQTDVIIRILMNSLIGFLAIATLQLSARMGDGILAVLGMFLLVTSFIFFIATAASLMISLVTIIQTTANGQGTIDDWPSLILMEWWELVPYFGVSLFAGVMPLFVWLPLTLGTGDSVIASINLSVACLLFLLCFTPVILATLSAGSPFAVYSHRIYASIALQPIVWLKFVGFLLLLAPALAGSLYLSMEGTFHLSVASTPWAVAGGTIGFIGTVFFFASTVGVLGLHIARYGDEAIEDEEQEEEEVEG